ncbi:hypothetical protein A1O1_02076 [Capronia coronata CBS 617.96]|uniref:Zn(2)-C6 fungal-type domain-containing protein n=1 Tax=Capronia coronata CBS 617.96 TaxID=1182541 RepID=W9ZGP7_9EURO|nr:uncharacterized protein A1O1_02076 [Capronia coronata CBS 617.96]EXJ93684.1 hypothetical protein A1O1_02076 [Capronia coronata CBS 617.96]
MNEPNAAVLGFLVVAPAVAPGDEIRPRCLRCVKAGRFCEGYNQPKAWLFEPSTSLSPGDEIAPWFNTASPYRFFDDDSELYRPTQYFMECTGPRIASYFSEMMDSFLDNKPLVKYSSVQAWSFWNTLVIQASEIHSCVRYSLAALSSLHEWIDFSKRTPWQNHAFTLHYTKAIGKINQSQGGLPLEIVLICCLLFAHCEFLMGASVAGLTHLRAGDRIISESRKKNAILAPEISESIEPIIRGFLAKSETYELREIAGPQDESSEDKTYALPAMPETFQDLAQANQYLQQTVYFVLLLELGQPRHLSSMTPSVRKYVNDWATAFGRWKARFELEDPLMKDWQLLLLAQHRMALLILKALQPEYDKMYSRAAADFRIMLAQLRAFLRSGYTNMDPKNDGDMVLKFHLGFIAPLYFIATQCRVREIRHNALQALKDLKVIEGHWNSCVAYAIAKTAIELEERFQGKNPSMPTRVKVDCVDRARHGTISMRYRKLPGTGATDDFATMEISEPACHREVNMQWVSISASRYRRV